MGDLRMYPCPMSHRRSALRRPPGTNWSTGGLWHNMSSEADQRAPVQLHEAAVLDPINPGGTGMGGGWPIGGGEREKGTPRNADVHTWH